MIDSEIENSKSNVGKVRILNTIADLLDEKTFEKITVTDICETAGISRPTFYRHFDSKYDAVNWFWKSITQPGLDRLGVDMTWRESLAYIYTRGEEYFEFFTKTLSEGYDSLQQVSLHTWEDSLCTTVTDHLKVPMTRDLELQIKFFAGGEPQMLAYIFDPSRPFVGEELAASVEKCVPTELHSLFDDAVLNSRAEQRA